MLCGSIPNKDSLEVVIGVVVHVAFLNLKIRPIIDPTSFGSSDIILSNYQSFTDVLLLLSCWAPRKFIFVNSTGQARLLGPIAALLEASRSRPGQWRPQVGSLPDLEQILNDRAGPYALFAEGARKQWNLPRKKFSYSLNFQVPTEQESSDSPARLRLLSKRVESQVSWGQWASTTLRRAIVDTIVHPRLVRSKSRNQLSFSSLTVPTNGALHMVYQMAQLYQPATITWLPTKDTKTSAAIKVHLSNRSAF